MLQLVCESGVLAATIFFFYLVLLVRGMLVGYFSRAVELSIFVIFPYALWR